MPYQLHNIDPILKPFVREICSMESNVPMRSTTPVRVLPDVCVELFINFREPQQVVYSGMVDAQPDRCFITSRMNGFMDVQSQGKVSFISVCFLGGKAYPFFPVPMLDVANQVVNLKELWGARADELQDRVDTAETTSQRVQLIQQFLIAQLHKFGKPDFGVGFCIEKIRQSNGKLSLEELAAGIGISNRQLVRRFNQYIGLSPKEFARMTTFLHALKHLKSHPTLSLTEIAYKSDYYDQAHFIRACRDFSGLTPGELTGTGNVLY